MLRTTPGASPRSAAALAALRTLGGAGAVVLTLGGAGAVILTLGGASAARAQAIPPGALAAPNAGALERQQLEQQERLQERERALGPRDPQVTAPEQPGAAAGESTAHFVLRDVRLGDSQFLSAAQLNAVIAPYLGQDISFAQLQQLLERINALYREQGQLAARALLPPQRIQDGIVRIDLVEARVSAITLSGAERVNAQWAQSWLGMVPGQVVDTGALDAALRRWNAASDARLVVDLVPGEQERSSAIAASLQEPPAWRAQVGLNNEGGDTTGKNQLQANLRWFSPLGLGEKIALALNKSQGLQLSQLAYSQPVHPSGTRLSASWSSSRFEVISGQYAGFVNGTSGSSQVALSQPLWQRQGWYLDGNLGYSGQHSTTYISGLTVGEVTTKSSVLGVSLTRRVGLSEWSLAHSVQRSQVSSAGTSLGATALQGSFSWVTPLWGQYTGLARANWQSSRSGTLPASINFFAGGVGSLRGYATGSLVGDSGYTAGLELHRAFGGAYSGFVFADTAAAWGQARARVSAGSLGVGAEWRPSQRLTLGAQLARALNPGLIAADAGRCRLLLRASLEF